MYVQTKYHKRSIMVRGGQSKNDNAEIDRLFRLVTPNWVCNKESEDLRAIIINNEWFNCGLQPATIEQYKVALRKWLRRNLQMTQLTYMLFVH